MQDSQPLVSILTDTKNRAHLISRCIESIQNQTYTNYEHIIADGGTDNTEEIVKSYNDSRIKYVKVPEGGPVKQTLTSFNISSGKFITFLDDDDEYLPEKIEKQLELIQSLPDDYGFIYGSMSYYDNKTNKFLYNHVAEYNGGIELLNIAVSNPVICGTPTLMFRREAFISIGSTWVAGIGNERSDWAMACKTLKKGWKVAPLKESYLKIYVNHSSTRMSSMHFYSDTYKRYIKFHEYFLNEYSEIFAENISLAKTHYYQLAPSYIMIGNIRKGVSYWKKLLKSSISIKNILILPYYILKLIAGKLVAYIHIH